MTRPIRSALAALMLLGAGTSPLAQAAGVLRIAVNPIYPPLEFRDPVTDALTGFDIDFGNALAKQMNMTPEW
ncbi:transporter substrate-binding domain-containing protein, partial [Gluconobacter kondonii]|uniref:transporter substrate-binding domain-containing protein n=1 Tax=Gluconobacter kondonii TaxID=941463 RepID=UPI003570CC59